MRLLLLGNGPSVSWVRTFLEESSAGGAAETTMPEILVVEGPSTRELLVSLLGEPIDALVLVDHTPFVAGPPATDLPSGEAVRSEAQRAILALELARRAVRTLVLVRNNAEHWPASLAGLLAELQAAPLPERLLRPCPPPASWREAPATPLIATYLAPLFVAAARPAPLVLAWPRECFLDGDAPGETLPATVEIAGSARILAYGPYLPLPAGNWHATVFLGFSPDIGKLPFILEVDTGGAVARGFFEVERGGIFSLGLDFQVVDAMHPVELRLISQDSALEGQLALIEVELEHSSPS